MKSLVWWRFWWGMKFRKTYETKIFKHTENARKFQLFIEELGYSGWQIVNIETRQERINGGELTEYKVVIAQCEKHIGISELFSSFKIGDSDLENEM